jgi:hypothetical protein
MVMDWMYDNFDLNVAEANALGIVYGFCQDGESWYRGGSSYIAARLHISQKSAKNYLNDFTKRGILTMKKVMVGNVECNAYQTVPGIETLVLRKDADPGKNFPSEKISPVKILPLDPGKNFPQTREKFSYKKEIENTKGKSIYPREERGMDAMDGLDTAREDVLERFREQLELDTLERRYEPEKLEELLDNIADMYCCPSMIQTIGQYPQTTQSIRKRLDKLTSQHIEYVLDALLNSTKPVHNIRGYIRAVLLNAPTTMEHYYQAKGNSIAADGGGRR